jgi:CRISPR-associated endoribonuclease Cas6
VNVIGGEGRFQIQRVAQITPSGVLALHSGDQSPDSSCPTTAADIFRAVPAAAASIDLHLSTPLRLKERDRIVRRSPTLAIILERLLGRINTLAAMYCGGLMLPPEEKSALITLARTASIETDNTQWRDWHRRTKGGRSVNFGGITGDIRYANVPAALLPWLSLGQWTGVGGKTSFGLGRYSMETEK